MDRTKTIELTVTLPEDIATEALRVFEADPQFFERVVLQAVIRRGIYARLGREADGEGNPIAVDHLRMRAVATAVAEGNPIDPAIGGGR